MGVKVAPYEQMDQEAQKLPYLSGFESVFVKGVTLNISCTIWLRYALAEIDAK